jgi:hypothetical protein
MHNASHSARGIVDLNQCDMVRHAILDMDDENSCIKGSATMQEALLAAEWSAIIFSGMLAVLFLSWALELRLPQINISNATESGHIGAPL